MLEESGSSSTVKILINGRFHRVTAKAITGSDLRLIPTPPISDDFELLLVTPDLSDLLVRDEEIVELHEDAEFIAVPRRILAGDSGRLRVCPSWRESS